MLNTILKLEGVQLLTKNQQQMIAGGGCTVGTGAGDHKYLYSGGEVVGESCRWNCDNGTHPWGGCPLLYKPEHIAQ